MSKTGTTHNWTSLAAAHNVTIKTVKGWISDEDLEVIKKMKGKSRTFSPKVLEYIESKIGKTPQ
jgi:hypothetical protein